MNNNKVIGAKIKNIRETKKITLEEIASRTNLSIEQIQSIENNSELPSLAPLIKIARSLGCRLGTFLDDCDELGPVICRKDERDKGVSFSNNATEFHRHMSYFSLAKSKSGRHMEPFVVDVEPAKEGVDFILSTHEGEEFIYCLEGIIEINYGKNVYLLEEGDSIYYDSIISHHVHAAGCEPAKILAVVYTPF